MKSDASIEELDGIGPAMADRLAQLSIHTLGDLIHHFPRDYDDRRTLSPIDTVNEADTVTVLGTVVSSRMIRMRGRANMAVAEIEDETGSIKASWFGRGFLANSFQEGKRVILSGTVGKYQGLCFKNPDYEFLTGDGDDELNTGRIVPIYRLTEKVSQRVLRKWIATALEVVDDLTDEHLPETLRNNYDYPSAQEAIRAVHYPESMEEAVRARDRLVYEELFTLQLKIVEARKARVEAGEGIVHTLDGSTLAGLRKSLPFTLTGGQSNAIDDILGDMTSTFPTRRLLQGDVGCGKTLVACHAIAAAVDGGFQVAVMVPTEVLAEQHYKTLRATFDPLQIPVALLTGATEDAESIRSALAKGAIPIVVGTHALIQESTTFGQLGLVIIDEQHRFGVMQRQNLLGKGKQPDVIQMTATPIPRTLAITVYGGCDLSLIDELPPGRLPIKTSYVTPAKVSGMYDYVRDQSKAGYQTYIVCPLVEESETRAVKNVTEHFEELSSGVFAELRTALLHGRMKSEEKESIVRAFAEGEVDILISTSVIEVGIDCPNATTIIIEDASNFGLTQLHQLRGRVGRGSVQSHCFLVGKPKTPEGKLRIEALCATTDGFKIAEDDLKLRGSGEVYGTRQAGMSDFRIADLVRDIRLVEKARVDAQHHIDSEK